MRSPLRPTFAIGELPKTDPALLASNLPGIRAYFYDLDQTNIGHYEPSFSDETLEFFGGVASGGVEHQGHISNASYDRTPRARQLTAQASASVSEHMGEEQEFSLMTSAIAADILGISIWRASKPFPHIVRLAVQQAGFKPEECAYFGDLYRTDIAAARLAGLGAVILTKPYGNGDSRGFKELEHRAQAAMLKRLAAYASGTNGHNTNGHSNGNGNGNGGR